MRKCWAPSPEERPSFRVLKEQLIVISQGLLTDWLPALRTPAHAHDSSSVREPLFKHRDEMHSHDTLLTISKQMLLKHKEESHSHDTLILHSKQNMHKHKEESHSHDTLLPTPKLTFTKHKDDTLPNKLNDDCQLLDTLSRSHRETLLRLLKQYSNESVLLKELVTHCLVEKNNATSAQLPGQPSASGKTNNPQPQSPPRTTLPRTKKTVNVSSKDSCDACISTSRQPPWLMDICKIISENAKKKWYITLSYLNLINIKEHYTHTLYVSILLLTQYSLTLH